jgi:hypothetical protein
LGIISHIRLPDGWKRDVFAHHNANDRHELSPGLNLQSTLRPSGVCFIQASTNRPIFERIQVSGNSWNGRLVISQTCYKRS